MGRFVQIVMGPAGTGVPYYISIFCLDSLSYSHNVRKINILQSTARAL